MDGRPSCVLAVQALLACGGGRCELGAVPSAEAGSLLPTLGFPPLTWRALPSRRQAADLWLVPAHGSEVEFRTAFSCGLGWGFLPGLDFSHATLPREI